MYGASPLYSAVLPQVTGSGVRVCVYAHARGGRGRKGGAGAGRDRACGKGETGLAGGIASAPPMDRGWVWEDYTRTYMDTHIHGHTHTSTCKHIHTRTHTCTHAHTSVCVLESVRIHTYGGITVGTSEIGLRGERGNKREPRKAEIEIQERARAGRKRRA